MRIPLVRLRSVTWSIEAADPPSNLRCVTGIDSPDEFRIVHPTNPRVLALGVPTCFLLAKLEQSVESQAPLQITQSLSISDALECMRRITEYLRQTSRLLDQPFVHHPFEAPVYGLIQERPRWRKNQDPCTKPRVPRIRAAK